MRRYKMKRDPTLRGKENPKKYIKHFVARIRTSAGKKKKFKNERRTVEFYCANFSYIYNIAPLKKLITIMSIRMDENRSNTIS